MKTLIAFLNGIRKKRPSNLFGRGIVALENKNYFEFQTAKICVDDEWNEEITQIIKSRNQIETYEARQVLVMPDIVTINDVMPYIKDLSCVPVGIANKNIDTYLMNFKNLINIMITNKLEDFKDYILNLIDVLKLMQNIDFHVFDAENILSNDEKEKHIMNDYVELFKNLNNSEKIKENVFVIIGLDKFIMELESDELFYSSLNNAKSLKKCYYLVFDSVSKLSNHMQTEWYQRYVSGDTGIWLGNNVSSQFLIKPNLTGYKLINMCGDSFGYAISKGTPSLIKLLGMKEKKEDE